MVCLPWLSTIQLLGAVIRSCHLTQRPYFNEGATFDYLRQPSLVQELNRVKGIGLSESFERALSENDTSQRAVIASIPTIQRIQKM